MIKSKSKKLMLSTETLRNLSKPDLQQVAAGVYSTFDCTATHGCSNCRPCY